MLQKDRKREYSQKLDGNQWKSQNGKLLAGNFQIKREILDEKFLSHRRPRNDSGEMDTQMFWNLFNF